MSWSSYRPKNKMGNRKVEFGGYLFDSGLERSLYGILQLREKAGEIRDIKVKDPVTLVAGIKYIADFAFTLVATGERVRAESKGHETAEWKLKLKLYREFGEYPLEIWKGTKIRPVLVETVIPRQTRKDQTSGALSENKIAEDIAD